MEALQRLPRLWPFQTLSAVPPLWWVCGGVALAVHVGRGWRPYNDIDIVLRVTPLLRTRLDKANAIAPPVAEPLKTWLSAAVQGSFDVAPLHTVLIPELPPIDIRVVDTSEDAWRPSGRSDAAVAWERAVLRSSDVPYLSPELVLLGKSSRQLPSDDADARHALPHVEPTRLSWLRQRLPNDHPWRALSSLRESVRASAPSATVTDTRRGNETHA